MSEKLNSKQFENKVENFEVEQQEHILESGERSAERNIESEPANSVLSHENAAISVAESVEESIESDQLLRQFNNQAEGQPADIGIPVKIAPKARQTMAKREIKTLQKQESFSERTFSRVIHQPAVRVLSEVASSTVSRPSGLLGGGLMAFMGSGSYLVLAKYLHFTYNYSVSLLLFAGGFVIGLLLELTAHLIRHKDLD
jgi:hypothetical protein